MPLFLVQHGISLAKDIDPERGLSEEGRAGVEQVARAAGHGIAVSGIRHSGKKRARQTAEILAEALQPANGVAESAGLAPLDDVAAVAKDLAAGENLMLVGHLPFMERLASYLLVGSADVIVVKFTNGGIVCLDQDPDSGSWFVSNMLLPRSTRQ